MLCTFIKDAARNSAGFVCIIMELDTYLQLNFYVKETKV